MTIEQAIKKAVEAGWNVKYSWGISAVVAVYGNQFYYKDKKGQVNIGSVTPIFLDPSFWQCLGKAMGWKNTSCDFDAGDQTAITTCSHCHFGAGTDCREWLFRWHSFIDALAEGRTAEDWFKGL